MRKTRSARRVAAATVAASCVCAAAAAVEIRLIPVTGPPYEAGEELVVKVYMTDVGPVEAVGFQAFLAFDSAELDFVAASCVPVPFGLPVIPIITAVGEYIDMASGVDVIDGQSGTTADSHLATLIFDVTADLCLPDITFRAHDPPSRVTDEQGNEILPLDLLVIGVTTDCNGNEIEDACDIGDGTSRDCNANAVPDECETLSCPADLVGVTPGSGPDGIVGIDDFLDLLAAWGPCA